MNFLNGRLKRLSLWASIIGGTVIASSWLTGWLWPKVRAIVEHAETIEWVQRHRAEYPDIMRGYESFRVGTTDALGQAAEERQEMRQIVMRLSEEIRKVNETAAIASALSSTNQGLLYELLTLKHRELGLPPPKRPPKPEPTP